MSHSFITNSSIDLYSNRHSMIVLWYCFGMHVKFTSLLFLDLGSMDGTLFHVYMINKVTRGPHGTLRSH